MSSGWYEPYYPTDDDEGTCESTGGEKVDSAHGGEEHIVDAANHEEKQRVDSANHEEEPTVDSAHHEEEQIDAKEKEPASLSLSEGDGALLDGTDSNKGHESPLPGASICVTLSEEETEGGTEASEVLDHSVNVEYVAKSLPSSDSGQDKTFAALNTDKDAEQHLSGQGTSETDSGTPPPGRGSPRVNKARKSISRPTVRQEQKSNRRAKATGNAGLQAETPTKKTTRPNHLHQRLASTQPSSSAPKTLAAASASTPASANVSLASGPEVVSSRTEKRKMETHNPVTKRKFSPQKQKSLLALFDKAKLMPDSTGDSEENVHKSVANESEEDRDKSFTPSNLTSTSDLISQIKDEPSNDPCDEAEDEITDSDSSSRSILIKRVKAKSSEDWFNPPRKMQKKLFVKGTSKSSAAQEAVQDLALCTCRVETPKSREILILADWKCMATEVVDQELTRCRGAILKHEMMRPSKSVPLLVLCEDHRNGMTEHQCCPGCGLFCRSGTFMECQPDASVSHRFHSACVSVSNGQRFCPHCGEEISKAKEVTITKNMTISTVPRVLSHKPPTLGAPKEGVYTTTGGSSCIAAADEFSVKADSSLPVHSGQGIDDFAIPGGSRSEVAPLPRSGVASTSAAPTGLPKETLNSILVALDTEKPKKLRFHPRQLYISASQGELKKVIMMLIEGIDPNFKMETYDKRTPLHTAAARGHEEICHVLIQSGANLNMRDGDERTPLMNACENDQLPVVRYLLRAGASINQKDIEGFTSLHLAAKSGHYRIVEYLLSWRFIDINSQDDGGWTALIWAAEYKHLDQVKLLLIKGADPFIRDKEQNTCLHWASFSGCVEVARLLIDAHCDLQAVNIHGDSPLHIATREKNVDCVKLLLSQGADLLIRNCDGDCPMDICKYDSQVWLALQTGLSERPAQYIEPTNEQDQVLHRDITRGHERVPIPCVNCVDSEPCPMSYKYIPENCVTTPVNIDKNITHLQYCVCEDNCVANICLCGQLSLRCWYDERGCLLPEFYRQDPPYLFECNHACSCLRTCKNRVVQNGLRVRLQLFRTTKKGWGVQTLQDIPMGAFICEYVGEIISSEEVRMRGSDDYLFTLNCKLGKEKNSYCLDARFYGNIARFINHSCEPNLIPCPVFTTHQDTRFPHIAFFAFHKINAGDELGFDYGDSYWKANGRKLVCECGSRNCRYSSSAKDKLEADTTPEDQQQEEALPDPPIH